MNSSPVSAAPKSQERPRSFGTTFLFALVFSAMLLGSLWVYFEAPPEPDATAPAVTLASDTSGGVSFAFAQDKLDTRATLARWVSTVQTSLRGGVTKAAHVAQQRPGKYWLFVAAGLLGLTLLEVLVRRTHAKVLAHLLILVILIAMFVTSFPTTALLSRG